MKQNFKGIFDRFVETKDSRETVQKIKFSIKDFFDHIYCWNP